MRGSDVRSLSLLSAVMTNASAEGEAKEATYGGRMHGSRAPLCGPSPRGAADGACVVAGVGRAGAAGGLHALQASYLRSDRPAVARLLCP